VILEKGIGLAIGGGAARALCCIGVLDILLQHRIEIRAVSGTSMGGVLGALHCAGHSPSAIAGLAKDNNFWSFARPNLGVAAVHGLLSKKKLKKLLANYLPETFEELKTPLCLVAVDLDTGEKIYFDSGPLIDSLLATISIPVLFPPQNINNRWVVDGGLAEQIPVSPLLKKNISPVVAVSSGFIAPKRNKYRGLFAILIRTLDLMGKVNIKQSLTMNNVIPVVPNVEGWWPMAFSQSEDIINAGRREMIKVLDSLDN